MEDGAAENQHQLRRLVWSIQSSYGRLNLLVAICDNWKYRDEIIATYETELRGKGARCDRLRLDPQQPSLKRSLQAHLAQQPDLATHPATVVTVLGADELLGLRLNQDKSALEQFLFSLQWTRESLRGFQLPLVLWLTPRIAAALANQAPDFWSWRGGVFEFSQPMAWAFAPERYPSQTQIQRQEQTATTADPANLQRQIDELLVQDPDSPLLASLYHSLGQALKDQVRYAEAEGAYRQALQRREQQLGADHSDVATSLNNLAELYRAMGRYGEAEPLYLRALAIYEQQLGADHPSVAISLNNLAALYYAMGRYGEAEPLYERSLAIREHQLGADHPDVANSLNNLAELYRAMGYYGDAEPLYERSLAIKEHQLGADHPDVAQSLNNLALLYKSMGRYGEAEPLFELSLAIYEHQLGADHPDVATSLNNLAELYRVMGRYGEAEPLYERSLAIREHQLGADHPDVATSLNNLAALYESMGRYGEAEPLYLRALAIFSKALPENHPSLKTVYNNFKTFIQAVLEAGQADQLSDHPVTQALINGEEAWAMIERSAG
ncbi:tetratricopeptide repeat protein [Nodosilinea sp. P-1105]|uniref:tetratricopeptide repeat protein n=1 Tax=Nodosilinea sp. P-1105 TaxID=2546229 RepID=UPI00197EEAEC|nr:tetratricopeptide repeat protein [Nodosilinea sp. P-1105]